MSVTVDRLPLPANELGLRTVGQVLAHLQKDDRLVVNVLIDGQQPDLNCLPALKASPLDGHTLYIETADPEQMALDVLNEVEQQLAEADRLKTEACELLQLNQNVKAMEKLSGCFTTWQHAQESVLKTTQLLRIDLEQIRIQDQSLTQLMELFTEQLRQIKTSLENRDFVTLSDILTYETTQTSVQWRHAISAVRAIIHHH